MASVVVVEDDPGIRRALISGLTERGHAVTSYPAGLPVLEVVVNERPDVVVLDLGLPDIDGRSLLAMIRAVSDVPVLVVTAQDDDQSIVATLDAGADDYVVQAVRRSSRSRPGSGQSCAVRPRRPTTDRSRSGSWRSTPVLARPAWPAGSWSWLDVSSTCCWHLAGASQERWSRNASFCSEVWQQPYGGADTHPRRPPVLVEAQAR